MKTIFKSKTTALAAITAAAGIASALNPVVGAFIAANAPTVLTGLGAGFFLLRLVTKKEIYLFPRK